MITIYDKSKCVGCSACASICPKKCITMKEDEEGFLYPLVDQQICVNCGLCEYACPVYSVHFESRSEYPDAYLGYTYGKADRIKSAAGGAFYTLAKSFIELYHGIVFGAVYDENYRVYHGFTDTVKGLRPMQKSKYVQSNPGQTFLMVKEYLEQGRYVLYSGTPCQIYGLKSFLDNLDTDRLFCMDLSCHGVPSPKLLREYLAYQKQNHGAEIVDFRMRDKQILRGAYAQGFGIAFSDGTHYFQSHGKDLYGRCFWGEIASRPSCYQCPFKTIWRESDITLGDCWFFDRFIRKEKDDLGVTMMLVHSQKGQKLLKQCTELIRYPVDAQKLIQVNGGMVYSSADQHPLREEFFKGLGKAEFSGHVKRFFPDRPDTFKVRIQRIMEKLGIRLEPLRRLSRSRRMKQILKNSKIPESAKGINTF